MPNGPDSRTHSPIPATKRFPVNLPAVLEVYDTGQRAIGAVVNVSAKGVFAASRILFPVGTRLHLSLVLSLDPAQREPRRLVTPVEVRWINDPDAPQATYLPAGMGLEFVNLTPAARAELQILLTRLALPEWDPLLRPATGALASP